MERVKKLTSGGDYSIQGDKCIFCLAPRFTFRNFLVHLGACGDEFHKENDPSYVNSCEEVRRVLSEWKEFWGELANRSWIRNSYKAFVDLEADIRRALTDGSPELQVRN